MNAVIRDDNPLLLFQYVRTRGYAGNRLHIPRPDRFKQCYGSRFRLKTALIDEEVKEQLPLDGIHMLEQILLPSYGVTSVKFHAHQSELLWSYPSAGACYPIEMYVVIRSLEGVPSGIYYYSALQTSLYKLKDLEEGLHLEEWLLEEDQQADFYFIVTTVPWRSCWKYSYKGYRFSFIDAGHVTANFQLILHCLGLRTNIYTSTVSDKMRALLQLDQYEDTATVIAVHRDMSNSLVNESMDGAAQLAATSAQVQVNSKPASSVDIHDRPYAKMSDSSDTGIESFDWRPIFSFRDQVSHFREQPDPSWLASHKLPREWNSYTQALQLITNRRSSSSYQVRAIENPMFMNMLHFIEQLEMPGITLYLFIHSVEGIEPGIYRWTGELTCLKQGDFRELSASLCLGQMFVRDCSALLLYAVEAPTKQEENCAVYQQRLVDVGMLGQMIYLKSQELGLGYSAIGGYYDEEVREELELPPHQQIIYAGTLGMDGEEDAIKHDRYRLNKG